ncbi:uncharacterized protein Dwil_GK26842 [Drosophila willistoni]|uniref:Uncharacterized protein n=1 Tax=Drosophila willistoni TaxID=7260 RepID=A0A0Q9WZY4_DROWI|nr:uncharacterized protein Dwil_GK26842 [Drosophila willistoni]
METETDCPPDNSNSNTNSKSTRTRTTSTSESTSTRHTINGDSPISSSFNDHFFSSPFRSKIFEEFDKYWRNFEPNQNLC